MPPRYRLPTTVRGKFVTTVPEFHAASGCRQGANCTGAGCAVTITAKPDAGKTVRAARARKGRGGRG